MSAKEMWTREMWTRRLRPALFWIVLGSAGTVLAADDEVPEMEFLEYLGMWEESDEDWVMLDESVVARSGERNDPVPKSEESAENDDES